MIFQVLWVKIDDSNFTWLNFKKMLKLNNKVLLCVINHMEKNKKNMHIYMHIYIYLLLLLY